MIISNNTALQRKKNGHRFINNSMFLGEMISIENKKKNVLVIDGSTWIYTIPQIRKFINCFSAFFSFFLSFLLFFFLMQHVTQISIIIMQVTVGKNCNSSVNLFSFSLNQHFQGLYYLFHLLFNIIYTFILANLKTKIQNIF